MGINNIDDHKQFFATGISRIEELFENLDDLELDAAQQEERYEQLKKTFNKLLLTFVKDENERREYRKKGGLIA